MKFGILVQHQLPRPWADGAEHRALNEGIEQVVAAEAAGFHVAWEVEHHFLEEYSHSSAPEVFLGACSQRTDRIRLGHGVVQMPHQFNHPVRVAERVATLDLLSDGRVEFGTGEGSSEAELGAFHVDRDEKRQQWTEAVDAVTRMFVESPFAGYEGDYLNMPPRNVVPKPLQTPHPPLWVGCSQRATIRLAAERGMGALCYSFAEAEDAKAWVDDYYAVMTSDSLAPAGFAVNANVACALPFYCHVDEEVAVARALKEGYFFTYSLGHYYMYGTHRPGRTSIAAEFAERGGVFGFDRDPREVAGTLAGQAGLGPLPMVRGAIGTPDQVREVVRAYDEAGVDQLIFVAQMGALGHDEICESLSLFGREVLPEFAAEEDNGERAKQKRLHPFIDAALGRRPPARDVPEDYHFEANPRS